MPTTTINRKNAQVTRSGTVKRKNKQAAGRPGSNGANKAAPRVIANTIFALTLKPKVALQVRESVKGKKRDDEDDDYYVIYDEILPIIHQAVFLVQKEHTSFDPLMNGFDLSQSFDLILNMFKTNVLPKGWFYNIERSGDYYSSKPPEYHLVIYAGCEFSEFWHSFEIKPVVEYMYKSNRRLHDFFIRFIANFCLHTGIDSWRHGGFCYVDVDTLRDQYENSDWETASEKKAGKTALNDVIKDYTTGDAHWYEQAIKRQPHVPVAQLRKEVSRYKKTDLVQWMLDACDFMEEPWSINDFVYPELDEAKGEGLMYDLQSTVIWSLNDIMTREHEEYLDCEAQGCGINEPLLTIRLKKNLSKLDFEELKKGLDWPKKITALFWQYYKAIKPYERQDKSIDNELHASVGYHSV